jgi:hypothetical protein
MKKRTRKPRRAMKESVPPRQIGSIAISNGPYFEPISVLFYHKSSASPKRPSLKTTRQTWRPLKIGQGPSVVMYPVSLSSTVSTDTRIMMELLPCEVDRGPIPPARARHRKFDDPASPERCPTIHKPSACKIYDFNPAPGAKPNDVPLLCWAGVHTNLRC